MLTGDSIFSYQQVHCNHPDLIVIKIRISGLQILVFLVYIKPIPIYNPGEVLARHILSAIRDTIYNTLQNTKKTTSLILSGDFNHHHLAWGGNHV